MAEVRLETPKNSDELYLARGVELEEFQLRPAFTGDVYQLDARLVALIQHPCAMRRGSELSRRLLVAEVAPLRSGIPDDWASGHYKRMFLPGLLGEDMAIGFDELDVLDRDFITSGVRVAILSNTGVDLLAQRWLFHSSRVVIPTMTLNAQSTGPFEEADLVSEGCWELTEVGWDSALALQKVDEWLGESQVQGGPIRREMLSSAQHRSVVRTALRQNIKQWKTAEELGS